MTISIVDAIQTHLTGDVVTQLSSTTGESSAKAQSALTNGAYAATAGLIHRGATLEGAQGLLSSLQSAPAGIGIFGDRSDELASAIASSSGVNRTAAQHVLGIVGPIAAGILGRRVAAQRLDAGGLSSMLMGERRALLEDSHLPPSLRPFLAEGIESRTGAWRPDVTVTTAPARRRTPWGMIALLALAGLALLGLLMMLGRPQKVSTPAPEPVEAPVVRAPEVPPPPEPVGQTTLTGAQVEAPKQDGVTENFTPGKSFALPGANFAFGSTDIVEGGNASIDRLAAIMKEKPNARIRLDGHTDSVGTADINGPLSRQRADTVKKMLVADGIDESRIETGASGAANPVAPNDTREGRQTNRRVEVTVLSP